MIRKNFGLNPPFREIKPSDTTKEFESEFLDFVGITLTSFVEENKDDKYVWVYELEENILAVLSFLDMDSYFFMDIVAVNESFPDLNQEVHPGYSLFNLLEDLSPKFNYSTIRLDSTSERVSYWKKNGYEIIGMPASVNKWGKLFPMEKRLH